MTCPRCSGFVLSQYGETRCLCCGWYQPPAEPIDLVPSEQRWTLVLCECGKTAMRGKSICLGCRGLSHGVEHGELVKRGMSAAAAKRHL